MSVFLRAASIYCYRDSKIYCRTSGRTIGPMWIANDYIQYDVETGVYSLYKYGYLGDPEQLFKSASDQTDEIFIPPSHTLIKCTPYFEDAVDWLLGTTDSSNGAMRIK